jgi:hypothetical protein
MSMRRDQRVTRRDVVAAAAATMAFGVPIRARGAEGSVGAMYFVPGGRIGFARSAEVKPWTSSWHLLSPDQTLKVGVSEALRIDPTWDDRMWAQDSRQGLVASGSVSPDLEYRRFRDQRYGSDANYGADTCVFRDDRWIGQIQVSTGTLGSPLLSIPGGQIARWRPVIDAILASLTVRSPPPVSQALDEYRVRLTVEGLNPRLVGDHLILSLAPPNSPFDASGVTGSHIFVEMLSALSLGRPEELADATNAAFNIYRGLAGSRVVSGVYCRGVVLRENKVTDTFATTLMAFGRTRQLKLTAFYDDPEREHILRALENVLSSLDLPDGQ